MLRDAIIGSRLISKSDVISRSYKICLLFRFRTKGLEIKKFRGKTMRKLFQGTRFDALSTLFDDNTYVLYGKDPETLRQVVIGTDKYNWITLLGK